MFAVRLITARQKGEIAIGNMTTPEFEGGLMLRLSHEPPARPVREGDTGETPAP
ncbi:hypothetical protein SAMN05446589_9710 [Streptomyces sp. OV198]|jgi:hypothetical protein|nr:hypothetical protein SAMN05446589_9710 [Streptomyces sp. OV198]